MDLIGLRTPNNGVISVHFGAQVTTNLWNGRWYVITDGIVIARLQCLSSYADHEASEQTRHAIDIRDSYNIDEIGYPYRRNRSTRRVNTVSVNAPEVFTSPATAQVESSPSRRVRTIERNSYSSMPRNVDEALERIPYDEDGVRRSYGVEYEINALTGEQESDLAYLLDTLPPHVTERDSSLSYSGVEIIFQPMSKEELISVVKKLGEFVVSRGVDMDGTGMHITFGVSNSITSEINLTIRMNRLALAIKAVSTKPEIERVFGRDFTNYARLPIGLTDRTRYRAFNVRNDSAVECRLVKWNCNIEKIMELLEASMVLFKRPFEAADFMKVFEFMGSNTDGE